MKKRMITVSAILAAVMISAAGCTIHVNGRSIGLGSLFHGTELSGVDTTVTYDVSRNYTEIDASGLYKIVYTDAVDRVELTCDRDLLPYVVIRQEDNGEELALETRAISMKDSERVTVLVPLSRKSLESIELSGACSFVSESVLDGNSLEVSLSGASKLDVEVEVNELDIDMSGVSHVTVAGSAGVFDAGGSGASKLSCRELKAARATVELSGASKCELNSGYLDAELSGASKIYVNEDAVLKVTSSGASKIERY